LARDRGASPRDAGKLCSAPGARGILGFRGVSSPSSPPCTTGSCQLASPSSPTAHHPANSAPPPRPSNGAQARATRLSVRGNLRVNHAIHMAAITIRHLAYGDLRKVATKCVSRCLTGWARTATGERGSQRVGLRLWRAWVALAVGNGHPSDAVRADCPPAASLDPPIHAGLNGNWLPGTALMHSSIR
jgi:hypothetical protein